MPVETAAPARETDLSADQRWAVWLAKGVEHDRKSRARLIVAAAVLAVIAIVAAGVLLLQ